MRSTVTDHPVRAQTPSLADVEVPFVDIRNLNVTQKCCKFLDSSRNGQTLGGSISRADS